MSKKLATSLTVLCLISAISLTLVGEAKVKAYRNIYFGDSRSTVKRKIKNDPKIEFGTQANSFYSKVTISGQGRKKLMKK